MPNGLGPDNSIIEDEIAKKHPNLSKSEIKRIVKEMERLQYLIKMFRVEISAVPRGCGRELELKRSLKELEAMFNKALKETGIPPDKVKNMGLALIERVVRNEELGNLLDDDESGDGSDSFL